MSSPHLPADARPDIYWIDNELAFKRYIKVTPEHCGICGSREGVALKAWVFNYDPRRGSFLIAGGSLLWALMSYFSRYEAEVSVPLCPRCHSRWVQSGRITALVGIGGIIQLCLLASWMMTNPETAPGMWIFWVAFGLWVVALIVGMVVTHRSRWHCKLIDDEKVVFSFWLFPEMKGAGFWKPPPGYPET